MGRLKVNGGEVWHKNYQGAGTGMDADKVDGSHKSEIIAGSGPTSPTMSYNPTSGKLDSITYGDGSTKEFNWDVSGRLNYFDFIVTGEPTIRKTFIYNPDGSLDHIEDSTV